MKTAADITNYLVKFFLDEPIIIGRPSDQTKVSDLLIQMGEFLSERLEADTPHKVIWKEFKNNPEENAASLSGILEALFEAQPGVRKRVDAFMQEISVVEARQSERQNPMLELDDDLITTPNESIYSSEETTPAQDTVLTEKTLLAQDEESNPPTYLYSNERADFESVQKQPIFNPLSSDEDMQIIHVPDKSVPFPHIFPHLSTSVQDSTELSINEKHDLQEDLHEIHLQMIEEKPQNEKK